MIKLTTRIAFWFFLTTFQTSVGVALPGANCYRLAQELKAKSELGSAAVVHGLKFAEEHNLPTQVLEVGPAEDRRSRLFVGVDVTNPAEHAAYLKEFQLTTQAEGIGGHLVAEFAHEVEGQYVIGGMRRDDSGSFYRWGAKDANGQNLKYVRDYMMQGDKPIVGFGNVIALTPEQARNVDQYLQSPEKRAKCKSDNCIAWVSSIELGKTEQGVADADREFLFTHLGVSRASAHFEISRRLIQAANGNHGLVVVLYNGAKGRAEFENNLRDHIPKDPQKPYSVIIHDFKVENKEVTNALQIIPDGGKVFFPIATGASPEAFAGLIDRAGAMEKGFDVHVLVNGISEAEYRRGAQTPDGKMRLHALFLGSNLRKLYTEGKVSVIPGNLSDFTRWMGEGDGRFQYDAIVVRVAPADAQGRYSLGPNHDHVMTIIRNHPEVKVIAEVNPNIPRTFGDNFLLEGQIASRFNSTAALDGPPVVPLSNVEITIGNHLGKIVPSGATIQLGIGNIFGGLPGGLRASGVKDLTIRTEMFGDPLKEIMDSGIANKAVTGFAYGSGELYKWLNNNQRVEFQSTETVNNPQTVMATENFHAINTALQVNLSGESNATMGPNGRISSPGGQVEFMTGAARSRNGKGIIVIRSTAKGGTLSSIVLDFYKGPITTPHESVTHVVTEYGVALLRGKSEPERALALINVAHPKFREELLRKAIERNLLFEQHRNQVIMNQPEIN